MLKIIAGKHKNRIIPVANNARYRPSTGRLKEAIFSILSSGKFRNSNLFCSKSNVLDLFCGSGSLGFEALSRGVASVTFIDIDAECLRIAKNFADNLGESNSTFFVNINALSLPQATRGFDLVFIDPPYHKNIVPSVIETLLRSRWLNSTAVLVVEMAKTDNYQCDNMRVVAEKIYGNSKLLILQQNV